MSQHSPLPWRLAPISDYAPTERGDELNIDARGLGYVCCAGHRGDAQAEANAALIVRAVNAHEELVAALRMAVDALDCEVTDAPMDRKAALLAKAWFRAKFGDAARAALAKAGAK